MQRPKNSKSKPKRKPIKNQAEAAPKQGSKSGSRTSSAHEASVRLDSSDKQREPRDPTTADETSRSPSAAKAALIKELDLKDLEETTPVDELS